MNRYKPNSCLDVYCNKDNRTVDTVPKGYHCLRHQYFFAHFLRFTGGVFMLSQIISLHPAIRQNTCISTNSALAATECHPRFRVRMSIGHNMQLGLDFNMFMELRDRDLATSACHLSTVVVHFPKSVPHHPAKATLFHQEI